MKLLRITPILGIALLCLALIYTSCTDDDKLSTDGKDDQTEKEVLPDFTKKTEMSVDGFITDEDEMPLEDVAVTVGDTVVTTNKFGHFVVDKANLVPRFSFVSAQKDGYITGYRSWNGEKDGEYRVHIVLLKKQLAGSFNATDGGEVTSAEGVKLTFPANAIITEDKNPYSGKVNVFVRWLEKKNEEFFMMTPGDQRYETAEGKIRSFIAQDAMSIELWGDQNQRLGTAQDKPIDIHTPSTKSTKSDSGITSFSYSGQKGVWAWGEYDFKNNKYIDYFKYTGWMIRGVEIGERDTAEVRIKFIDKRGFALKNLFLVWRADLTRFGYSDDEHVASGYTDKYGESRLILPRNLPTRIFTKEGALRLGETCERMAISFSSGSQRNLDLGTCDINTWQWTILDGSVKMRCTDNAKIKGYGYFVNTKNQILASFSVIDGKVHEEYPACGLDTKNGRYYIATTDELDGFWDWSSAERSGTLTNGASNTINITKPCKTFTLNGTATTCNGQGYSGGTITFKPFNNSADMVYTTTFVNGVYSIKINAVVDKIEGRLEVRNRDDVYVSSDRITIEDGKVHTTHHGAIPEKTVISGTAVDCDNNPLTNAEIQISATNIHKIVKITDGTYSIVTDYYNCANNPAAITVKDLSKGKEVTSIVNLVSGNNIIPQIRVCDAASEEFSYFKFQYDGKNKEAKREFVTAMYTAQSAHISGAIVEGNRNSGLGFAWKYTGSKPVLGTFDVSQGTYWEGLDNNNMDVYGEVKGKITITEVEEKGSTIKLKGTFTGNVDLLNQTTGAVIETKPIQAQFLYSGKNNTPQ